jgi:predicted alpha/beta superfamily hydrolase
MVGLPVSYEAGSGRAYPVLYVFDADTTFCTVLETARSRAFTGEVGEVLVVGIGYPVGTDVATWGSRRTYDFSVDTWDRGSAVWQEAERVMDALGQPLRIGGAPALVELVADRVRPLVAELYGGDPADQALFGHSAGGNFLVHALLTRPEVFTKVAAACPGFVYNDWHVFELEERYAAAHDDLAATVYLAAGSDEALQMSKLEIASGTARMAETLKERGYPSLRLVCEFFTARTHETATTEILQRALELFWPGTPYDWSDAGERWRSSPARRPA